MSEALVEQEVKTYFTDRFPQFSVSQQCEVYFGTKGGIADIVLHQSIKDEKGYFVAIAECKKWPLPVLRSRARAQLKSYMSTTNTRYGVLAVGTDPRNWEFCENKYNNWFVEITREEFEKGIENWCPVSVESSEINRQREQKIAHWWQRSAFSFLNLFFIGLTQ
ncbi:MAG: type I restriction enzyme HsdR N-terminal domain-containing protein [Candidatus Poribacteria bacterium]|nr:type I restriction enzyme HsdR N-terminal domain-containing protein [Candidatus Poribacteria bacterium]